MILSKEQAFDAIWRIVKNNSDPKYLDYGPDEITTEILDLLEEYGLEFEE
jgi:hypothetical protein